MPCNRLGTRPLDYIKEGRVPSWAPDLNQQQAQGAILDRPKQDVGFATLAARTCINLVSRVLVHTFEFSVSRSQSSPHNLLPRVPPW
jgi:hypothetical protein